MEASAKGLTRWEISDLYSPPELSWSQGFVVSPHRPQCWGPGNARLSRHLAQLPLEAHGHASAGDEEGGGLGIQPCRGQTQPHQHRVEPSPYQTAEFRFGGGERGGDRIAVPRRWRE